MFSGRILFHGVSHSVSKLVSLSVTGLLDQNWMDGRVSVQAFHCCSCFRLWGLQLTVLTSSVLPHALYSVP